MNLSKLKKIHIIIIGAVVCVLVAAGLYFVPIKKASAALQEETKRLNQYASTGTQMNVDNKKADVQKALQEVAEAQIQLDKYMRTKMPNLNFARRDIGMLALWHEQSEVLGPLLINWIKRSDVKLSSSISIPAPPVNPNSLSSDPNSPIRLDLGKVKVEGNFKRLMEHVRRWNSCNRLVMIDSPTLSGQSPNLSCEYGLTVFLFPRTPAGPEIPMAGGGAGAGGMAGVPPGGMPGIMPGMPPGGPPGAASAPAPAPTGT